MVVSIDESILILVDDSDVGLESFDDFSEEAVFLYDISFEFVIDAL